MLLRTSCSDSFRSIEDYEICYTDLDKLQKLFVRYTRIKWTVRRLIHSICLKQIEPLAPTDSKSGTSRFSVYITFTQSKDAGCLHTGVVLKALMWIMCGAPTAHFKANCPVPGGTTEVLLHVEFTEIVSTVIFCKLTLLVTHNEPSSLNCFRCRKTSSWWRSAMKGAFFCAQESISKSSWEQLKVKMQRSGPFDTRHVGKAVANSPTCSRVTEQLNNI